MTYAWQRAKAAWEVNAQGERFEFLLGRYIAEGCYVWSSPELFILACPVSLEVQNGETVLQHGDDGDTWFIHLAAVGGERDGDPREFLRLFLDLAPFPLPYVAWHRRGSKRLHRYAWSRLVARANLLEMETAP